MQLSRARTCCADISWRFSGFRSFLVGATRLQCGVIVSCSLQSDRSSLFRNDSSRVASVARIAAGFVAAMFVRGNSEQSEFSFCMISRCDFVFQEALQTNK